MKFKFNYHGRKAEIDVKICNNFFSQFRGLMFRENSKPLLFIFKKSAKQAIHSFFCKPFYAVWFDNKKIIDEKMIDRWRFWITPAGKFDRLLEIPSGCREFLFFADGRKV